MNTANVYEDLYTNMKNRFTVVEGGTECTLGEAMLMRAGKKKETSTLPVKRSYADDTVVSALFKYVNEKLTLKTPPAKDKTMKRFPLHTSISAVLSAVIACTLVISFGTLVLRGGANSPTIDADETYYTEIEEDLASEK